MKKTILPLAIALGSMASANAAVTLVNGDFETGSNWRTDQGSSPTSWDDGLSATSTNGLYGETVTYDTGTYGSGRVAVLKDAGANAYYEQTIGTIGDQTGVIVDFLGGHRAHASYSSTARDLSLRVSLWDGTLGVELVGTTIDYAYTVGGVALTSESETLNYTSANGGNDLVLRFANVSNNGGDFNHNQTIIDNVSVTAVPEPSSTALLGLGGIALILRRRK